MKNITFCKGGGCTTGLGPGILERVLSRIPNGQREPEEKAVIVL